MLSILKYVRVCDYSSSNMNESNKTQHTINQIARPEAAEGCIQAVYR